MFKAGKEYLAVALLHVSAKISLTNFMGLTSVYYWKKLATFQEILTVQHELQIEGKMKILAFFCHTKKSILEGTYAEAHIGFSVWVWSFWEL